MLTLRTLLDEMGLELACGKEAADAPLRRGLGVVSSVTSSAGKLEAVP